MSAALRTARKARLVATGWSRTKSLLPNAMQQKYCDQGLSVAVLRITRPTLRARSSCGSGGKPRKASTFPSANSSLGLPWAGDPSMSLCGSSRHWRP